MNSFLLNVLFKNNIPYDDAKLICNFFGNTFITITESYNSLSNEDKYIGFKFDPDFTGEIKYNQKSRNFIVSLHSDVDLNYGMTFYADNKTVRFTMLDESGIYLVEGNLGGDNLQTYYYNINDVNSLRPDGSKSDIISINKEFLSHTKYIFDTSDISPQRGSGIIMNSKKSLIPFFINGRWINNTFVKGSKK